MLKAFVIIFIKDLRKIRWLLAILAGALGAHLAMSIFAGPWIAFHPMQAKNFERLYEWQSYLLSFVELMIIISVVQADSLHRNTAVLLTRPVSWSAVCTAKMFMAFLAAIVFPLTAEWFIWHYYSVPFPKTMLALIDSGVFQVFFAVNVFFMAAITPDIKKCFLILIIEPVLLNWGSYFYRDFFCFSPEGMEESVVFYQAILFSIFNIILIYYHYRHRRIPKTIGCFILNCLCALFLSFVLAKNFNIFAFKKESSASFGQIAKAIDVKPEFIRHSISGDQISFDIFLNQNADLLRQGFRIATQFKTMKGTSLLNSISLASPKAQFYSRINYQIYTPYPMNSYVSSLSRLIGNPRIMNLPPANEPLDYNLFPDNGSDAYFNKLVFEGNAAILNAKINLRIDQLTVGAACDLSHPGHASCSTPYYRVLRTIRQHDAAFVIFSRITPSARLDLTRSTFLWFNYNNAYFIKNTSSQEALSGTPVNTNGIFYLPLGLTNPLSKNKSPLYLALMAEKFQFPENPMTSLNKDWFQHAQFIAIEPKTMGYLNLPIEYRFKPGCPEETPEKFKFYDEEKCFIYPIANQNNF
ncbi:MAG: hypothetical protein WCI27_09950 [Candidatus Omnitrophota bacterium]